MFVSARESIYTIGKLGVATRAALVLYTLNGAIWVWRMLAFILATVTT